MTPAAMLDLLRHMVPEHPDLTRQDTGADEGAEERIMADSEGDLVAAVEENRLWRRLP